MQNIRFFICVSLFLALSGSGAVEILDYKTLCIKCVDEKAFPECPSNEISNRLNLTIYCQRLKDNYCTLGILNEAAEDVFSTDSICRLNQIGRDLGGVLQEDENNFKIVSIMEEPLKPLPLLLLSTTSTISNKITTDFDSPAAEIEQNTIENGKPTAETIKNINATVNLSTEAENHSTEADKTKRETVKPVTEPTTDTVTPTKDTVKLLAETVKPITEDVKSSTEAVKTAETSVKPPNNDAGHIEILSITQNAVEPSKPDISHMAIVANPDTMAALEDGTNSGDAAAGAEEAEKPAEAPETSPEAPETPLVAPETPQPPADAPEPPAEEPVAPAEASDAPAEAHETPAETPDAPAETPEAPAESPEAPSEAHMATTETPDAAADTPEAPGPEEPNADKEDKDSNKEPMDYQGDEGKPDGDIDADAPPKPLDKPNDVPEKVPGNPSAAGNKPTQAPIKCFTCTTLSNSNCTMRPDKEIDCPAVETGKNVQNGCYTMFNGDELQRGCLRDMTAAEFQNCLTSLKCRPCTTSLCNNASWPQCYNCDSSSDPLCAQWPAVEFDKVQSSICTRYDDQCVMRVDEAGVTQRFCANASEALTCANQLSNATCVACVGNLCNGGIFPPARQRCLQCAGNKECAEPKTSAAATALPCLLYRPDDHCFLFANATNHMIRGCASNAAAFNSCLQTGRKCLSCSKDVGCNDTPQMKAPSFKCFRCNSLKMPSEYESCIWAQNSAELKSCERKYPYYQQESCLTIYNAEMNWAVRECSLDFGACEPSNQYCQACQNDGCNGWNMAWQHCVECNTTTESNCGNIVQGKNVRRCSAQKQTYELRGCYTMFNAVTNVTSRGCISDMTPESMKYCKDHIKYCQLCHEQGCNHHSSSVANFLTRLSLGQVISIVLAVLFVNNV